MPNPVLPAHGMLHFEEGAMFHLHEGISMAIVKTNQWKALNFQSHFCSDRGREF